MFNDLKAWVEELLGTDYQYSQGAWVETESLGFVCCIFGMGGAGVDMDIRRPRFKIMLLGPRGERNQASKLLADIESIIDMSINSDPPCGAASIRAITEPTGPGYTEENRAWVSVDFQIIY